MNQQRKDEILDKYAMSSSAELIKEVCRLQEIVDIVDDVLVVNWIAPPTDPQNYKKALYELCESAINTDRFFQGQKEYEE